MLENNSSDKPAGEDPSLFECLESPPPLPPSPLPEALESTQWPVQDLFQAIEHGDDHTIKSFLKTPGANPNVADETGYTLLHHAAQHAKTKYLSLLIEHGARVDATTTDGKTPLHCAATHILGECCIISLVEAGANRNAQTRKGDTPLHLAASCDLSMNIERLLKLKADTWIQNEEGCIALHYAVKALGISATAVLASSWEASKKRDRSGRMPLDYALDYIHGARKFDRNAVRAEMCLKSLTGAPYSRALMTHFSLEAVRQHLRENPEEDPFLCFPKNVKSTIEWDASRRSMAAAEKKREEAQHPPESSTQRFFTPQRKPSPQAADAEAVRELDSFIFFA